MKKQILPLLLISALTLPIAAYAQDTTGITGTRLDINAQATIKAKPDIATVSAGVVTRAKTAQEAREQNAQKMQAVFKALKEKKIADSDMQTAGLTINPEYHYDPANKQQPQIIGYQANNSLTIRLRDMDKIGDAIDILIKNGINQFNGPSFSLDNPDEATNEARRAALEKARKRAELYASATGLKIKRIVSISENTSMGMPVPMMMMAKASVAGREMADTATPIATGQVDVDVTVNVAYELAQ